MRDRFQSPPQSPGRPASGWRRRLSILHLPCAILVLSLIGCQSRPAAKPEAAAPLNYSAYLYSLYDTDFASRPKESLKEDRLTLKPRAIVAVARLGEYAPREALLQQLRAETNLFSRVEGIPAVLEIPAARAPQGKPSAETVKDHIVKMRQLAADIGADYLYLVGGDLQPYVVQEPIGVLDLTILGYFVIGSNRIEIDARGSSVLVDVASGRVLSVATEQDKQIRHVPTSALEDAKKRALEAANARMEESLTKKLVGQLESRKSE